VEASCVDNASDACRARACNHPAGAGAFQASFAMRQVRTLTMWLLSSEKYRT